MAQHNRPRLADPEWTAQLTAVLESVKSERKRQLEKWGPQSHTPEKWLTILMEEVGEVAQEILQVSYERSAGDERPNVDDLYKELIQVSAVAAAFAQALLNGPQTDKNQS